MRFGTWLRGAGARAIWLSVACMLLVGQSLSGAAVRSIPGPIGIGETLAVTVNVTPASGVSVYAVEEFVGSGWEVEGITVNGAFDQHTQTVKWGPFFDNQARELQYVLVPTMDSVFPTEINGTVSVDGVGTQATEAGGNQAGRTSRCAGNSMRNNRLRPANRKAAALVAEANARPAIQQRPSLHSDV